MRQIFSNHYPKISVVTPSLNQADTLEKTIVSVLGQDYPNLEYIIMDGGSTDGSVEIIRKYEKSLAFWQSKTDGGQVQALNAGFKRSTGQICAWLNADDFYRDGALKEAAGQFIRFPFVDLIFGDALYLNEDSIPFMKLTPFMVHLRTLAITDYLHQPSVFFSKRVLEKAGFLNESYNNAFDYDLWVRIFKIAKCRYDPFLFSASIISKKSKTFSNWPLTIEETEKIQKDHFGSASLEVNVSFVAFRDFGYVPNFSKVPISLATKVIGFVRFIKSGVLRPICLLRQTYYAIESSIIRRLGIINWNPL
ncbi:MAG: glycosyltransferase family 2 protein [Candidatus Omnitrophica bacterium]|nr:glycosyltransferase family 2 protein [Candidatus Omnitrophota bacterium]